MDTIKALSLILLAVYLIFNSLTDFFGLHLNWIAHFGLGAVAVAAGVLILIGIKEYLSYAEE